MGGKGGKEEGRKRGEGEASKAREEDGSAIHMNIYTSYSIIYRE